MKDIPATSAYTPVPDFYSKSRELDENSQTASLVCENAENFLVATKVPYKVRAATALTTKKNVENHRARTARVTTVNLALM